MRFSFGLYVRISSARGSGCLVGGGRFATAGLKFCAPGAKTLLELLLPSFVELIAIGCFGANLERGGAWGCVGVKDIEFVGLVTEERDSIDNFSLHSVVLLDPSEVPPPIFSS